jgi:hypothetical protein
LNIEYRFAAALANMDVDGPMFVAVKEEPISVLLENLWHRRIISKLRIAVR